jgi:DNA transposition AAA+ family ATPase
MKPVFVYTQNVKNFGNTMEIVKKRMGYDSLAMVSGRAGRGKTKTALHYATQHDCTYLTTLRDWSVLWMYQDILTAMGFARDAQPRRKKTAFEAIIDTSKDAPRPIILDEADLLGPRLLESVRDLCKMMHVPWVLVGEESLYSLMSRDRRVWSRSCAWMEFLPMSVADIVTFCAQAAELKISTDTAETIQKKTGGDIRLIELLVSTAETVAKANSSKQITDDIAQAAIKRVIPEAK